MIKFVMIYFIYAFLLSESNNPLKIFFKMSSEGGRLSERGVYFKISYYNLKNTKYPHNFTQMFTQCSKI